MIEWKDTENLNKGTKEVGFVYLRKILPESLYWSGGVDVKESPT